MPKPHRYKTIIAIPSYGRAGNRTRFNTLLYMSDKAKRSTRLYVEKEELSAYTGAVSSLITLQSAHRADKPKMWGSIMDLMMDDCLSLCDNLVLMDDDLALAVRPDLPKRPTYYEEMTGETFDEMLEDLYEITTPECPLTSAQYRQFCQGKTSQYQDNQRISMIWSMNSQFFLDHPEFRFYRSCGLSFMTDYYFFLSLLAKGHSNRCINKYTKDDKPNAEGGESTKRTKVLMKQSALALEKGFPGFAKAYEKKSKNNWEDGMYGVRLQASRLFKWAQTKTPR